VRPTLIDDVPADHRLAQEEIFGPVQVLIAFDGEAEAIAIANGTKYGLVAGVWTRDGGRQMRMARALRCGQVFVNNYGAAAASSCRSAASSTRGTVARRASRRCTASRR
jgi:aldehyde dehydrogenase (NAD+)